MSAIHIDPGTTRSARPARRTFATVWTVLRKELRDIVRDRRTLLLTVFLGPVLTPLLMLGLFTLMQSRTETQLEEKLEVPVLGAEHAPNLLAFLAGQGITVTEPPGDIDAAVLDQDVDVALAIDPQFAEDWRAGRPARVEVIHDSTRRNAEIPVKRLRAALTAYREQVGALRLYARGIDASITRPISLGSRDLATPEAKGGIVLSMLLPYLLIFISFIGGMALILDATAGERERQSLEPLLATPASRGALVSGKLAAAGVLGLLSVLLTLLALKGSAQLASGIGEMLDVRLASVGKLLLILVPMILIGNSLLTLLAASAKSLKEAQSHMSWVVLLPMLPSMVLMFTPLKTQLWQFAVPFLAQNQMILKVVRGEPIGAEIWAVYLLAGFGLAALLWFAAVRLYRQEKLAIAG
ncbi:ABC transporter permease [Novilysobacter erysipheiresistens]|uniref:ABC transporter permease n=1 Tax=Novilysobacter erysipheiresistens TaxID=1749332 RepID=A0ABU7YY16_9GAMM